MAPDQFVTALEAAELGLAVAVVRLKEGCGCGQPWESKCPIHVALNLVTDAIEKAKAA